MNRNIDIEKIEFIEISTKDREFFNSKKLSQMKTSILSRLVFSSIIMLFVFAFEAYARYTNDRANTIINVLTTCLFLLICFNALSAIFAFASRKLSEYTEDIAYIDATVLTLSKDTGHIFFSGEFGECSTGIRIKDSIDFNTFNLGDKVRVYRIKAFSSPKYEIYKL